MLFRKEINPYSVTDKVTFRNGDKTLKLQVKADAMQLVINLKKAQDRLTALNDDSPDDEKIDAARMFAKSIFGNECDKLMEFYEEPLTVITVCGMYFKNQLSDKITKAQKK